MSSKENRLSQKDFDELLIWLDSDRELAGQKYEIIRSRLITIFTFRGCSNSEDLADETIDRVARKVRGLSTTYTGEPALYFYGVAKNVYLEYLRGRRAVRLDSISPPQIPVTDSFKGSSELAYKCLENCLKGLSDSNRRLFLAYYRDYKSAKEKIDHRKELASRLGVAKNALMVRIYRIRAVLEKCIKECIGSNQQES